MRSRYWLCAAVATLLLASVAAHECVTDEQLAQRDAACQESIKQYSASLESARADLAALKAAQAHKDAEIARLRQEGQAGQSSCEAAYQVKLQELQSKSAAQASQAQGQCDSNLAKVKEDLTAQVAQLQAQLSEKGEMTIPQLLTALFHAFKKFATNSVDEVKLAVVGLQHGDTKQFNILFYKVMSSTTDATKAVYRAVMSGYHCAAIYVDKYAPFVKEHAVVLWAQICQLYKTHVDDAAWMAEVKKQAATVNKDIKVFLSKQVKAHPALKVLDDPVYLQLLAYVIFAAPLLLLFLPVLLWLVTMVGPANKATSANVSKSAKKKKGKAAAAARPKA